MKQLLMMSNVIIMKTQKENQPLHYRSKEDWVFGEDQSDYTKPSKDLVTVPNETFTIEELIDRSRKGLPLTVRPSNPQFMDTDDFDSPDISELNRTDVVDAMHLTEDMQTKYNDAVAERDKAIALQEEERKRKIKEKNERLRKEREEKEKK